MKKIEQIIDDSYTDCFTPEIDHDQLLNKLMGAIWLRMGVAYLLGLVTGIILFTQLLLV